MVPVLGTVTAAYISSQQVGTGGAPAARIGSVGVLASVATTRHTVCSRAVVSARPSAGSRRHGSSSAVTRRCHTWSTTWTTS